MVHQGNKEFTHQSIQYLLGTSPGPGGIPDPGHRQTSSALLRAQSWDEGCVLRVPERASLHKHLREQVAPEQELEGWKAFGNEETMREAGSEGKGGRKCAKLDSKRCHLRRGRWACWGCGQRPREDGSEQSWEPRGGLPGRQEKGMSQAKTGPAALQNGADDKCQGSFEDLRGSLVITSLMSTSFPHQQHPDVSSGETLFTARMPRS